MAGGAAPRGGDIFQHFFAYSLPPQWGTNSWKFRRKRFVIGRDRACFRKEGEGLPPEGVTYSRIFFHWPSLPGWVIHFWRFCQNRFVTTRDIALWNFEKMKKCLGLPWGGLMVCWLQKGTLPVREYMVHSLKIWWKSVDIYYFLAFTENWKNSPKNSFSRFVP